eukprot:Colp12_sorted_trinity150504_noHs@6511
MSDTVEDIKNDLPPESLEGQADVDVVPDSSISADVPTGTEFPNYDPEPTEMEMEVAVNAQQDDQEADDSIVIQKEDLTMDDALQFMEKVWNTYSDRPWIYYRFVALMHEYKHKIALADAVQQAEDLFASKSGLAEEFRRFLPPNFERLVASNTVTDHIGTSKLRKLTETQLPWKHYINKVKTRFADQASVYHAVVLALKRLLATKDLEEYNKVIAELGDVLKDHPDLSEELKTVFPPSESMVAKTV